MKLLIGLIIAFSILVNLYSFLKLRKRRKQENAQGNHIPSTKTIYPKKQSYDSLNYKKQITKYNSPIDYIEKK